MIETALPKDITQKHANRGELAPNVWLRQDETEGQFVEIILPPFELYELLKECEQTFPAYAVQVLEVLAHNDPAGMSPETRLTPELTKGLFNTQLLGTVLSQQHVWQEKAIPILPELKQAFSLAMQGRLRLTVDPIPES